MIVCHCRAVNHVAILETIESGARDLDSIAAQCGAGSVCGGCRPTLAAFVSGDRVAPTDVALPRSRHERRRHRSIDIAPVG
ncbi:MAG TPA: (2Fe-2S)-binding protein [Acidimicrobiales bacterium]